MRFKTVKTSEELPKSDGEYFTSSGTLNYSWREQQFYKGTQAYHPEFWYKETDDYIPECIKSGNHDLIEISSKVGMYSEEYIVRWCTECGAIVIDEEIDGKIMHPGGIMKMKYPKISKRTNDEKN